MLRKFSLAAFLLCLFLVLFIGKGEAADLEMYVSSNTAAYRADTAVSTSTIIPGKHWILGFKVAPNNGSCVDPTVILYDAATTGTMSSSTQFDILEADTDPLVSDVTWYPRGKNLSLGLAIRQGGYTDVIIYYERRIQ